MTSATAISRFKLLMDEEGSAYFTDSNILDYLNMAQYEVLNRMVPDSLGGVVNFEIDQNTFHNIVPLVYSLDVTLSSHSGNSTLFTVTDINTKLRSDSGDNSSTVFRVLSLSLDGPSAGSDFTEPPIKYVSINKFARATSNTFTKGSTSNYIYTYENDFYRVIPKLTATGARFRVIKTPKTLTAGNSPEFDDYVMNQVILEAVKLAGVTVHNPEVIQNVSHAAQSGQ